MGLGGYLAARSDAEHYASEPDREIAETGAKPTAEAAEVTHILRSFGLTPYESAPIVAGDRVVPHAARRRGPPHGRRRAHGAALDPRAAAARPATMMTLVLLTAPESPAARANGTVSPSDIPITTSRTLSPAVKCRSMCGVCGMTVPPRCP